MNKGYPRNEAYKIVQEMSLHGTRDLIEVLKGIQEAGHLTQEEITLVLSKDRFFANVGEIFSRFF
jgi:adenylosuccinate lyase